MDEVVQLVVCGLLLSGAALVWLWWKGGRWLRLITVFLLIGWGYMAQGFARAMINVRWVDDVHVRYQHDAVLEAIRAEQKRISLEQTTNFEWMAVCRLGGYQTYAVKKGEPETEESRILKQVLGTDYIPEIENTVLGYEDYLLAFATPDGPYVMEPRWERFGSGFQDLFRGRYYKERLEGKGYWIDVRTNGNDESIDGLLCFQPGEIWLEIRPESAGAEHMPAAAE